MAYVIYDPGTGTVLGAEGALLLDTEQLDALVGPDSDVALSEEDPDAQAAATQIGRPLALPKNPDINPSPGPLDISLDRERLYLLIEDSIQEIGQTLDLGRNHALAEIINTGINNLVFDGVTSCLSPVIRAVDLSSELMPDNHLNPEAGIMITAWFSDEFGRMLTAQAVYYPPIDFEDDMADVMSNSDIITSITSAISSAVTTINHNTARDFDFLLRAL